MFRTRMLARLSVLALAAAASRTLAAEEPVGATPPAKSIREWKTTPSSTPAGATSPAKSIREWRTTPVATPDPCSTATPIANPPATPAAGPSSKPAVSAAVPTSPLTISIKSTLRQGNLVVMLDDVPIFDEKFQKPLLIISQTTTWDPLQVAAGTRRLTAKLLGAKKTYFSRSYDLYVPPTKGAVLRFELRGDKLMVELAS